MLSGRFLLDSNILLRWVQPDDRDFLLIEPALSSLAREGCDIFYASQNLGEFWNACTRPFSRNGFGLTTEETDKRAKLFESKFQHLPDIPALYKVWRDLLVRYKVSGAEVHDARLVAIMLCHEVDHILTFNTKDFRRYSEIKALHPEDVK